MARLNDMPDHGKVLVAAPSQHMAAELLATAAGLDYLLTPMCEPGAAYVMNVDAIRFDPEDDAFTFRP